MPLVSLVSALVSLAWWQLCGHPLSIAANTFHTFEHMALYIASMACPLQQPPPLAVSCIAYDQLSSCMAHTRTLVADRHLDAGRADR